MADVALRLKHIGPIKSADIEFGDLTRIAQEGLRFPCKSLDLDQFLRRTR